MMENVVLKELKVNTSPGKKEPVYHQIVGHIRKTIDSGVIAKGQRLPSMSDMIKEWSVGYPTIKSALQILENDGLIKCEKGRGKGPRVLVSPKKNKVSRFCFARCSMDSQIIDIEKGVRRFAAENQIDFRVMDLTSNWIDPLDMISAESNNSDGFIVYPSADKGYIKKIKKAIDSGVRLVFVDRRIPGLSISSVTFDNFSGAFNATRHLIEMHDHPVHYFGMNMEISSCEDRYQGWRSCMHEYFAHTDYGQYFWETPYSEIEVITMGQAKWESVLFELALKKLETVKSTPVSIFCLNADIARILYRAVEHLGLCVGTDVFLICFDDKPFCSRMPVPLSSVAMDDELLGYEAAKLLNEELLLPSIAVTETHRVLPVELAVRASSGSKNI